MLERSEGHDLGLRVMIGHRQAIDGVADVIWTVAGYTPGRFPRAEVFELPFTMTDAEAV